MAKKKATLKSVSAAPTRKVAVANYAVQLNGGNGGVIHVADLSELGDVAADELSRARSVTLKVSAK